METPLHGAVGWDPSWWSSGVRGGDAASLSLPVVTPGGWPRFLRVWRVQCPQGAPRVPRAPRERGARESQEEAFHDLALKALVSLLVKS